MKKLLFNPLMLLIFAACTKEKIVIQQIPPVYSWAQVPSLTGANAIMLTSTPLNDTVIAVANNDAVWYLNTNKFTPASGEYIFGTGQGYYAANYAIRPLVTKHVSVSSSPSRLYV
jgi:hypothetical protein